MKTKKHFNLRLVALLCYLLAFKAQAAFFGQHAQGWHWYQDPLYAESPKKLDAEQSPSLVVLTPSEQVKAYSKALEQKLHKAWVNPSSANIKAYQEMQKDLMQRSENFTKTWMQTLYLEPQLDHTLVFPVNQKGRHIYLDQQKLAFARRLQELKDSYGLFFFFRGDCLYCEAFAPIVQQFSSLSGWEVLAISTDGHQIPGFAQSTIDNGLVDKWKISVLPALFAVNPHTQEVLPLAQGLSSLDEIENRIMTLIGTKT